MPILRHLGRHALAYVALFAVLGGSALAAGKLALKNSVGSRQVIDHTLRAKDFRKGQLRRGPRGRAGAAGPTGLRGATGLQGPAPQAFAAANGTALAPADPSGTMAATTLVTTATGSVYVQARLKGLSGTCGGGIQCSAAFGVYIDGKPVPGAVQIVNSGGTCPSCGFTIPGMTLTGVAPAISAGSHLVILGSKPTFGAVAPSASSAQVSAVWVG